MRPPLVALDSNALDRAARGQAPEDRAFRHLAAEGRLAVYVPPGVRAEAARAGDGTGLVPAGAVVPPPARADARRALDRLRLRAILRGDGRPGKHDADADHLSAAAEAGCRFFVTGDGKVLRRRDALAAALPADLRVVTFAELAAELDSDEAPREED